MLESVTEVARSMGGGVAELAVEGEGGAPIRTLTITFAGSRIIAIARNESVQLVCVEHIDPDESALFARAPERLQNQVLTFVRLEGSRGRSRFHVAFEETGEGPGVSELVLEQRLFLVDGSMAGRQRICDGFLEITALAVRVRLAFDTAVDMLLSQAPPTTDFHGGMYF